jgi:hypothetical protein
MPIAYDLNSETRLLETRATGLVTAEELDRHLTMEEEDGFIGLDELFDARDATTDLTSTQVRHFVRRTDDMVKRGRFGAVAFVTRDDVTFGMARMYQLLCEDKPVNIGVFRDIDVAREWLDASRLSSPG